MRRREFITLLGGAAAWPLAARAQQGDRVRRIGYLDAGDENDPLAKPDFSAFTQALAGLGWTDGSNVRMDLRWGGADINRIRALAQGSFSSPAMSTLMRRTRSACCPRAATGHAAAPPRRVMNSRRRMSALLPWGHSLPHRQVRGGLCVTDRMSPPARRRLTLDAAAKAPILIWQAWDGWLMGAATALSDGP